MSVWKGTEIQPLPFGRSNKKLSFCLHDKLMTREVVNNRTLMMDMLVLLRYNQFVTLTIS